MGPSSGKVWQKLKNVALPDSRFHLNFEEYIPDFKDSINARDQIINSEEYKKSKVLFITPDNCLTTTREKAIKDGKDIIVSTYGIYRGFIFINKDMINKASEVVLGYNHTKKYTEALRMRLNASYWLV